MNRRLATALQLAGLTAGAALWLPAGAEDASAASDRASASTPQQLSKIKVQDAAIDEATTEGLGYAATTASIGKDARSLRELPNSMTVITRDQLTDQNLNTIESALKNVTGVTIQRFDATGTYTQFIARGYAADTYQLDGLNLQTDANGVYFDLAAYDRVEVQRGAAGLFSGAGEPGVTVNMARKRAPGAFQASSALSLSSWNDGRFEADVGGALNDAGTLRGRAVGVVQQFDTFMDFIDDNSKYMAYGTLEQDFGDATTVSIGGTWQSVDTVLSRGLPTWADGALIDMPRSTMPVMNWNYQKLRSRSAFAELEHRGADESLFRIALRHLTRTNEAAYLDPSIPAEDGTMNALTTSAFRRQNVDNSIDVYFSKPFHQGERTHNLLVGADYRRSPNQTHYAPYTGAIDATVNLFDVDPDAVPRPDFDYDTNVSDGSIVSYGAYAQGRYQITPVWTLIGGGRASWWKSDSTSNGTTTTFDADGELTPYVAAIRDVSSSVSLYASYNEIFKPQNATTVTGEQIEPRTGRQVELGLKGEAAQRLFVYSLAAYRLIDEHRAMTDPANPDFSIASGKARAQGIEADFRGALNDQWSLSGGYAFTETKYLRSTPAQQGQTISSVTPKHNGSLWVHYTAPASLVPGLELSAGVRAVSSFYNGSGSQRVDAPGYALFAVGGSYQITPRYSVAFNIDNLLDKHYWEKVSYPGRQNFFGEPRRYTLSLRASM